MTSQCTTVRLNPNKQKKHFVEQHNVLQPYTLTEAKVSKPQLEKAMKDIFTVPGSPSGGLSERDEGAEGEPACLLKKVDIFTRQARVEV